MAISDRKEIKIPGALMVPWMSFSPDGKWLALRHVLSDSQHRVHLWNCKTWDKYHWDINCKQDKLKIASQCAFDGKEALLYFNSGDRVQAQSLPPGRGEWVYEATSDEASGHMSVFDILGRSTILSLSIKDSNCITLRGIPKKKGTPVKSEVTIKLAKDRQVRLLTATAISPDGSSIAVGLERPMDKHGEQENILEIWSTTEQKKMVSSAAGRSWINCIRFSADATLVASGSAEGDVVVWDVNSGRQVRTFRQNYSISSIDIEKSGRFLAFTSYEDRGEMNLYLVDLRSGSRVASVVADGRGAVRVAFDPDGKTIATVGAEGIVRIWEIESLRRK